MLDFRPLELEDPSNRLVSRKLRELSESIYHALRDGRKPAANQEAAIGTPLSVGSAAGDSPLPSELLERAPVVPTLASSVKAPPGLPKPAWASGVGTDRSGTFADIDFNAGRGKIVSQRLRLVPSGKFRMGSPDGEPGRYSDERPRHAVTIDEAFWLFDTPCTQALWEAVMGDNPSRFKSPTRPVEQVSFQDVQHFLTRVNDQTPGLQLALPSEARWEYACRAGTETATYAGPIDIQGENNAPVLDRIAWYGGNSGVGFDLDGGYDSSGWPEKQHNHTKAGTHPVRTREPNAWGLYDMLGNVWEWCEDLWHDNYKNAPTDGTAWPRGSAARCVVRGAAWYYYARLVRAACRLGYDPACRVDFLGFRCARVPA
jgi:formylglycine-generating enzyme required for sulfatase activity